MIALRLARAGYFGGDPSRVLAAPADVVLKAVQYEQFCSDYERAWMNLNRDKP